MKPPNNTPEIDQARRLLAELEAETQRAESELHRMLTEGAGHFLDQQHKVLSHLDEATLDSWSAEQAALAGVADQSRTYSRRSLK